MNILFINSIQMWGGAEVWLMDMMNGLQQRGHSPFLICRKNTELAEKAIAKNFNVFPIRIAGDFDPFVIANIYSIIKKNNIDTICTNMEKDLRIGGIAGKLAGVKGIIPSKEVDFPLKNTLRYKFFYNTIATKVIVNSKATFNTMTQSVSCIDKKKFEIIYKGIDIAQYDIPPSNNIRKEFHLQENIHIVTFVGRLNEQKGISYLLEAWKNIHQQFPHAVLLLVGKGDMQLYIENFTQIHNLHSSIILTGFRTDIPSILLQSTMLVLPSLWEGFGYVLIEAMAAKIPTIATAISSIPEIVVHEKSGILVEPKNSSQLQDAITSLLSNPEKVKTMGLYGRKIVEKKFTIQIMLDNFEKIFLNEIGKNNEHKKI